MRSHVAGGMLAVGKASLYAGAALGTGLVAGLVASVREAELHQKLSAQTTAAIASTGGAANVTTKHIEDMAQSIETLTGVDDLAVQQGENLLLTFRGIRNEAGKGNDIFNQATQAITDVSVAMGQDMKSSAIQVGKALNDPIKGLTSLKRVGVQFTDQQTQQIKTLVESGHTMEAQKIILGELNKEFGGSAKAAGQTFEGQMNRSKAALGNVAQAIGELVLPALTELLGNFAKWVNELQQSKTAHDVLKSVLHALAGAFNFVKDVVGAVAGFIRKHWDQIRSAVQSAANFISNEILPRLSAALKFVKTVVGNLADGFIQAWPDIKKALVQAWTAIKPILALLGHLLSEVIAPAILWLSKHSGGAFKALATAVNIVATVATPIISALATALQKVIDAMKWVISHLPSIPSLNDILPGSGGSNVPSRGGGGHAQVADVYLDGQLVGKVLRDRNRQFQRQNTGRMILQP